MQYISPFAPFKVEFLVTHMGFVSHLRRQLLLRHQVFKSVYLFCKLTFNLIGYFFCFLLVLV